MHAALRKPIAALAIIVAGVVARPAGQQRPSVISTTGPLPLFENYLESLRLQSGIPGMSAVIVRDGAVVWDKGFGYANLSTREAATADTPYLAGDISETLASTLLLQCVEQRRIRLDDPYSQFGLTQPEPDVTPRQLLSHTAPAGSNTPFAFSPDRYAHLTELMEWCAPQPYRKSVAHRVLDPAVMMDSVPGTDLANPDLPLPTGLFDPSDLARYRRVLARLAVPYHVDARRRADATVLSPSGIDAAGGLVTTARDLAKFDIALEAPADDGGLLLPETRDAAWNPAFGRDGFPMPTGLGWFVQSYQGSRVVWQFGAVPNAYSALWLKLPDRHLTLILMANSDGLSAPFPLAAGDVTKSLFATVFLKLIS
jgi:CubicO group peptidase (beta-lactamase class C family)